MQNTRLRAGYASGAALSRALNLDDSYVRKFESLERQPPRDFAERCDGLMNTDGQLVDAWDDVDWSAAPDHPDWFKFFAGLEARALQVREYSTGRVSGLLQIPAYTRALFRFAKPHDDSDKIERGVAARIGRQARFLVDRGGPFLVVVLDEAVIRQHVGGPLVMRDQLQHLLDIPKQHPSIVIQVAPFALGEKTGATGGFTLLELPDGERWAYSESMSRGHAVSDPATIEKHIRAYDRLRAEALSAQDSARFITSVMRELVNVTSIRPIAVNWRPPREWKTASYSQGDGGQCVEVATNVAQAEQIVPVRDSKDRSGPELGFSLAGWSAFVAGVRAGEFGAV
ncbi:Scr1 family TA system antitoxin-like transcriptional regulator [Kitasatospora sp. NPDC003701]